MNRIRRAYFMRRRRLARTEQWVQARREPLRRALAEIYLDHLLALHWLRYLLIRYHI